MSPTPTVDYQVTTADVIINDAVALSANAAAGATTLEIDSGSAAALAKFSVGDVALILQVQGAQISAQNSASYGAITALGGAGQYELVRIVEVDVAGGTLTIGCGGLRYGYSATGKTQVVRMPAYRSVTVQTGASLRAPAWNGSTGGVLAFFATRVATVDGDVSASGAGFRGGSARSVSMQPGDNAYVSAQYGGEKGEGIAGFGATYDGQGGRYARGAAANGGGGGNAHNAGGGGGGGAGDIAMWTGQGVMDGNVSGAMAWTLDPAYIAAGALTTSTGGGRGGYSSALGTQDGRTVGPGSPLWMGDNRRTVGGWGGRPLASAVGTRLFFGGGGGAGDADDGVGGSGGSGGGLVFIVTPTVQGNGTITANGAAGGNTAAPHTDGAGGGGGGGAIVLATTELLGVRIHSSGGAGGSQGTTSAESDGPGGGGGGGYIALPSNAPVTHTAAGGSAGSSLAPNAVSFAVNGATGGHAGMPDDAAPTTESQRVCNPTNLAATVSAQGPIVEAGGSTTYRIVVQNTGIFDVLGAAVSGGLEARTGSSVPSGVASPTVTGWTCVAAGGATCGGDSGPGVLLTTADLPVGGSVTYSVTVRVPQAFAGTLTYTGAVQAPVGIDDPSSGDNGGSATVSVPDPTMGSTPSPDMAPATSPGIEVLSGGGIGCSVGAMGPGDRREGRRSTAQVGGATLLLLAIALASQGRRVRRRGPCLPPSLASLNPRTNRS